MKKEIFGRNKRDFNDDVSQDEEDVENEITTDDIYGDAEEDQEHKPNQRFKNYYHLFKSLTKHKVVPTQYPIVSVIITYDSKRAITVTKKDDREFWVRQYDLETYDKTFDM
jgi:hypothetical protein